MDGLGLRERKKLQTRRALVSAALRLFAEKGYEQTTVAEIAADADVATKTFFNYFPSKDDVLFPDHEERIALALDVIANRRPDETVRDVVTRLGEAIWTFALSDEASTDPDLAFLRLRMILTVPALQARTLQVFLQAQVHLGEALRAAYPEQLDEVSALAVVGAWLGAVQTVAVHSLNRGDTLDQMLTKVRRATGIVLAGLPTSITPANKVRRRND